MDSELVFQAKGNLKMSYISYKGNRPPVSDYVSNQKVVPSEVIPGQTVLFYSDSYGCLLKGHVTFINNQGNWYQINGRARRGFDVRYSQGHGEA